MSDLRLNHVLYFRLGVQGAGFSVETIAIKVANGVEYELRSMGIESAMMMDGIREGKEEPKMTQSERDEAAASIAKLLGKNHDLREEIAVLERLVNNLSADKERLRQDLGEALMAKNAAENRVAEMESAKDKPEDDDFFDDDDGFDDDEEDFDEEDDEL